TGQLDQDPILALPLDRGLRHTELIDAVADRLEPHPDGLVALRGDLARAQCQDHSTRRLIALLGIEDTHGAEDVLRLGPGLWGRQLYHQFRASSTIDATYADPLLFQLRAQHVTLASDVRLESLVDIDAKHEVDAALQVQSEVDGLLGGIHD